MYKIDNVFSHAISYKSLDNDVYFYGMENKTLTTIFKDWIFGLFWIILFDKFVQFFDPLDFLKRGFVSK